MEWVGVAGEEDVIFVYPTAAKLSPDSKRSARSTTQSDRKKFISFIRTPK
jgi:hypothetical protein